MMQRALVAVVGFCLSWPACAELPTDALQWLQRVATAAQKLSYSGTFVYQNGTQTETSRITHVVDAGDEMERIEVLDGSPREVVRFNDEVKCFLPENRLVIIERRGPSNRKTFPALLPAGLTGLTEYYTIRKGTAGRVAGFDSQSIVIEPKDELRYGRQFWVDKRSGLLLKAGLINERGEPIETFTFTELRIGGDIDRAALKARPELGGDWKIHNVRTARGDDGQWLYHTQLPGFRKVMGMRRQARPDAPESTHVVFTDGLAAVSVFIEPLAGAKADTGSFPMGAINAYKRVVGDNLVVVIGDVPLSSLKRLADGIEPKQK